MTTNTPCPQRPEDGPSDSRLPEPTAAEPASLPSAHARLLGIAPGTRVSTESLTGPRRDTPERTIERVTATRDGDEVDVDVAFSDGNILHLGKHHDDVRWVDDGTFDAGGGAGRAPFARYRLLGAPRRDPSVPELTPTQRQIAIEHVKALAGTSKPRAANAVDQWNFHGLSAAAGDVEHVVGHAVAGTADPRSVALLLQAAHIEHVDLADSGRLLVFGRGGRLMSWDGHTVEATTGPDRGPVDVQVPATNPRRTARTLARLLD